MVGVEDVQTVTPRQMTWLRQSGRDLLYKLFNELESRLQALGLLGDFSGTIWLPTDVIVDVRKEGVSGGVFWTFGENERKEAHELAERIRESEPDAKVCVTTARHYMGIKGNVVRTDFNWHGHEGASIIFQILDQIFDAVEVGGDVVRLEAIFNLGLEKPVKLPFFAPKLPENEILAFASKKCKPGTFLIFPDKRVFRRTEDGIREATPEDIAELTFCAL